MTHLSKSIIIIMLLAALGAPGSLLAQAECDFDNCEVTLLDVEGLTDWTTNCDLITIPAPEPGEPDLRQICDPTFLILRDPTCGPPGSDSNFTELSDEAFCFGEGPPCNAVGFLSFCTETTLSGTYRVINAGGSAGDLIFNLAGCTKIYRRDDLFNPICGLEDAGDQVGVTLPAPSDDNPVPTVEGEFDTLAVQCALDPAITSAIFADICADPENFCFDAFSDGFIEIVQSNGNLVAETTLRGSAKICASYATFDVAVLADQIEPNCGSCIDEGAASGVVPVSFTLPDDGDDAVLSDYEDPANYRIVIDDQNDGDNDWDQTITPTGSGTYEFVGLTNSDFTIAIIYVPLANGKTSADLEACGFCIRTATVGLLAEPEVDADITGDCVPNIEDPGVPAAGNGAIDLTVTGAENIAYLWDNEATTPRIENLEAGQYCVTITYGPPVSDLDPIGRCSICLCFDVEPFSLTCDIMGDDLVCGDAGTTLTANPTGGSGSYSYLWSTGETTQSIEVSPIATTVYDVTITDDVLGGDCFSVCSKEVNVFNPTCEITGTTSIWLGTAAMLTAEVPVNGADFEYLWSNGATTSTITVYPIENTMYSVTITELNEDGTAGCMFECSETVVVTTPTCNIEGATVCCVGQAAALRVAPPDRPGNYEYKWNTGGTGPDVTVFPTAASNLYSVTITDVAPDGSVIFSYACEHEITVVDPSVEIEGDAAICQGEVATLTAVVTEGTGDYKYSWSNGQSGPTISVSPLTTTTYEVTVTDAGAGGQPVCTFTDEFTVVVNDLRCAISGDDRICKGESTILTAQATGGSGTYRYRWNTGETTASITVSPYHDKNYWVMITDLDEKGQPLCSTFCDYELEVSSPHCSVVNRVDVACEEMGSFIFTVDGGFPSYTYEVRSSTATIASGTIAENGRLVRVEELKPGEYTVLIRDAEGCTTNCVVHIGEIPGEGEFTGCLACNDMINVTLDMDCSVEISLDMVTEGSIQDCDKSEALLRALEVIVYDNEYPLVAGQPLPDNVVDRCGVFNYAIILKEEYEECFSWTQCWGKINAEDKSLTVEVKPEKVRGIYKYTDANGNIGFTPYDCTSKDFEDCFEDPFDKILNDCSAFEFNYLICQDVDSIYQNPRSYLDPAYPYFVGIPNTQDDCCGPLELIKVQDWLEQIPCEERDGQVTATIKRTFTYRNSQGMTSDFVQEICFYRPRLIMPDCKLHVDYCDFEAAGASDEQLTPANIGSLVREGEEAMPYYYNGICEKIYLTGHTCDLTVTYADKEFPATCGKKVVRTWTVLDWCFSEVDRRGRYGVSDGSSCYDEFSDREADGYAYAGKQQMKFEQQIIMEATHEMTIECTDLEVTTGPFNCTAVIAPEAPKVSDCIAAEFEFEVWGYLVDPVTKLENYELIGRSEGGKLSGVPAGVYDLFYRIEDGCGRTYSGVWRNSAGEWQYDWEHSCVLTVVDKIDPVVICDDDLTVSIGGAATSPDGISKIDAIDVDEGSWDNCSPVELEVRRAIELGCLDIYADKVLNLAWPTDFVARFEASEIVYLAGKDVPAQGIHEGDPLIVQELGGQFFSWWSEAAYFTCCDISVDNNDRKVIELRATDKEGNSNICWMDILVEDKLPPRCDVHDKTILCTELDFDPMDSAQVAARFGAPEEVVSVVDNCGFDISEEVIWTPGNCGTGEIVRVFTITDNNGLKSTCRQTITIESVSNYMIVFPGDVGSQICGEEPARDITAASMACDLLAINRDTTRFEASGDECFKLMITHRVINWCEYDGTDPDPIAIPRDWDRDGNLDEDTKVTVDYTSDLDSELPGRQIVTWSQEDGGYASIDYPEYPEGYNAGFWQYAQMVKVYDNVAPTITVDPYGDFCAFGPDEDSAYPCGANVEVSLSVDDRCTPDDTELRSVRLIVNSVGDPVNALGVLYDLIDNGDGTYVIRSRGNLPEGEHVFVVQAADGCGNIDGERIPFIVKDCKSPAPVCLSHLTVDLMPVDVDGDNRVDGGMNTVWATDFVASGAKDCNPHPEADVIPEGENDVKYYVFKQRDLANGDPSDITLDSLTDDRTSVVFTCDELGMQDVYVVALDGAGQFDYCVTTAVVQPGVSPDPCGIPTPSGGSIAGLIITEEDQPVSGVSLQLSGEDSRTITTADDGLYAFATLRAGYDYTVTPNLDKDHINGVSTFDLVMITKHILGTRHLDSPYKLIAADINRSRSITTLDVIKLRKTILGVEPEFSGNTSWRFVRADYQFTNPQAPWSENFPEVYSVNDLAGELTAHDFIAIKVGDVNGNAKANALSGDVRTVAGTFPVQVSDKSLKAGNEYTIAFTADVSNIQGYQFTLTFDRNALELVDMTKGLATEDNFGLFLKDGLLTTSWHSAQRAANGESLLFSLVFRAKSDAQLSDLLSINSRLTAAEAYNSADETLDVSLDFGHGATVTAGYELYQNQPNPFREKTLIGFTLPEATEATITVTDMNGRTFRVVRGHFVKGYNEITVENDQLPTGVLFYTLKTEQFSRTRKMIHLE